MAHDRKPRSLKTSPVLRLIPTGILLLSGCHAVLASTKPSIESGQAQFRATITSEGHIECFSTEFMSQNEPAPRCEVSAIEVVGSRVFCGSDKPIPGERHSALFYYENAPSKLAGLPDHFVDAKAARSATKFEAFARIHGTQIVLASTGFDRIREDGQWDGFNTLLAWQAHAPDKIQILNASTRSQITSSRSLREMFTNALKSSAYPEGPPYFKVEGLAVLPDRRVLFGLRETGQRYDSFEYHRTILVGQIANEFPDLRIMGPLRVAYEFQASDQIEIATPLGISSLAYDLKREGLWILTSYESKPTDDGVGGYLWFLPLSMFEKGIGTPHLINSTDGKPLHFAHKSEGLSVLSDGRLLIVHDDDRIEGRKVVSNPSREFSRQLNQSFYTIVSIHSLHKN